MGKLVLVPGVGSNRWFSYDVRIERVRGLPDVDVRCYGWFTGWMGTAQD